eukprot:TRINITY_DN8577_c0_g1_i1.p1 TRINITY_DN8577_c0_g1~~TRINITY_DN8577_c0_g1_i1.p1  ORF type:complete len:292 (+),score=55.42 TRINITY_DN8577_c0_g1_i1:77-952(+)
MGRKKRTGGVEAVAEDTSAGGGAGPADGTAAGVNALPAAAVGVPPRAPLNTLQVMLQSNPNLASQIAANPLLAAQLLQHAQAASAPIHTSGINPDVQELADHFGLDERITKRLDDEMKNRTDTFEGDLIALWDILETARVPAGLLSVKIKEMQDGTFIGEPKMDKDIKEFKKKYNLDDQATRKLAEVLQNRSATRKDDIDLIHRHLETSNKPSARIMMMLGKLRSGEPLGEPDKRIAPGSYLDRMEREKERKDRERTERSTRGRSRSRDRGRGRSRSRERRRSRSRDRRRY